jgi:hypothetical protein
MHTFTYTYIEAYIGVAVYGKEYWFSTLIESKALEYVYINMSIYIDISSVCDVIGSDMCVLFLCCCM